MSRRRFKWYLLAVIVALPLVWALALLLAAQWLERHPHQVADWLGARLDRSITIGAVRPTLNGHRLRLEVGDVAVFDRAGERVTLRFDSLGLTVAPERLLAGEWFAERIDIRGVKLRVRRDVSGALQIAGFETGAGERDWLFGRTALTVSDGEIELTDAAQCADCAPMRLHRVTLAIDSDAQRHRIEGSLRLSEDDGQRVQLQAQLDGDPRTAGWGGEIRLRLHDLDARHWLQDRTVAGVRVRAGRFDVQLIGHWRNGHLRDADGRVEARAVALIGATGATAAPAWEPADIGAEFRLVREPAAWRLTGRDLRIAGPHGLWPVGEFAVTAHLDDKQAVRALTGHLPGAPLADVLALVLAGDVLPQHWAPAVRGLRPSGRLGRIDWQVRRLPDGAQHWSVVSQLSGGAVRAWDDLPGVTGVNATVAFSHAGMIVRLRDGQGVVIDLPGLLRHTVKLDRWSGDVTVSRAATGWVIDGRELTLMNADAEVRGDATVTVTQAGRTAVQATASVTRMDGARVAYYLPAKLIPAASLQWLDQAFQAGSVTAGRFEFSGNLADFPFEHADQGRLHGRLAVTGGRLALAPGWPEITDVDATVLFDNTRLAVRDARGELLGARVADVAVTIPDMNNTRIHATGKALGSLRQLRRFVQNSPLRSRFTGLRDLRLSGDGALSLTLDMPLDERKTQFTAQLDMLSADVRLPAFGLHLSRVRGPVIITPTGITAQRLAARYAGSPIRVGLKYAARSGAQITARANLSVAQLLGPWRDRLPPAWLALAPGRTAWRLDINSPPPRRGGKRQPLDVTLSSPLRGLTLALPAPLGKTVQATRDLVVRAQLAGAALRDVQVRYGDRADAWLYDLAQLDALGGILRVGDLGQPLTRPTGSARRPGFEVRVVVPELMLDDWRVFARRFSAAEPEARAAARRAQRMTPATSVLREAITHNLARSLLEGRAHAALQDQLDHTLAGAASSLTLPTALLRELHLRAAVMHAFGQRLTALRLQAQRESTPTGFAWLLRVHADQLSGSVQFPAPRDDGSHGAVQARFDYLHLADDRDDRVGLLTDPARLPPLTLTIERLRFGTLPVGRLAVETQPVGGGMAVQRFDMRGAHFQVNATGQWRLAAGAAATTAAAHRSRFEIAMTGSDFGRTLADFGFTDELRAADMRATVAARWQGPPSAFELGILEGAMALEIGKGSVLTMNPGAGRLFGLLSLNALPRRLSGDFADIADQGFVFDAITGDFEMRRGLARTTNLTLEGPAARVEIAGEVNVNEQTYDQNMVIVPKVSDSLPVAGVVAGGLGLGAALLLVQQILGEPLNRIVRQRFRVTGPWADPVVTPVTSPIPPEPDGVAPRLRDQ